MATKTNGANAQDRDAPKDVRESRASESRASLERYTEEQIKLAIESASQGSLPAVPSDDPDYLYRWVRATAHEQDAANFAFRTGTQLWEPVKAGEMAGYKGPIHSEGDFKDYYGVRDVVLCRCPRVIVEARRAKAGERADRLEAQTKSTFLQGARPHESMPIYEENRESVSRGKSVSAAEDGEIQIS